MSRWQNVRLTKCHADKMSCWQNVMLTKCQVDKMSGWQNVRLTKCQVDKMTMCHSNYNNCNCKMLNYCNNSLLIISIRKITLTQPPWGGGGEMEGESRCFHIKILLASRQSHWPRINLIFPIFPLSASFPPPKISPLPPPHFPHWQVSIFLVSDASTNFERKQLRKTSNATGGA